ncbi:MAG: phage protein Gp27 family protein [Bryobacteraceae bacterium]
MKIDLLPQAVKDRILELRASFVGWEEIERQSADFVPWASLDPRVCRCFPLVRGIQNPHQVGPPKSPARLGPEIQNRYLPHSTLHRWYDLRVEQARRQAEAQAESSRAIAQSFLGRGYENLPDSIKNALADQIFALTAAGGDPEQLKKELFDLGYLVAKLLQTQTAATKTDVEQQKVKLEIDRREKELKETVDEAEKKIRGGKPITLEDINNIRQRTLGLPPKERIASPGAG